MFSILRQPRDNPPIQYFVETQNLASLFFPASSPEHYRRRKFLVLVEEEVAAGDRKQIVNLRFPNRRRMTEQVLQMLGIVEIPRQVRRTLPMAKIPRPR